MILKEILNGMVEKKQSVLLCDSSNRFKAEELLASLSDSKLHIKSFYQPGLYIARIDDQGFLGEVLYRVK